MLGQGDGCIDGESLGVRSVNEESMDTESVNVGSTIEIVECIDERSIDVESIGVALINLRSIL